MIDNDEYEEKRLLALRRFGLLDSPPEAIFDGITLAIANICEVPIALISLVDQDRQWFKSAYGLKIRETPRDIAFCSEAIGMPDELLVVEDAATDTRFRNNPLVTSDPKIRFYAGKPLVTNDGYPLGTLCVIDRQPRRLKQYQYDALAGLSRTVAAIFDERNRMQAVAIDRDSTEDVMHQRAQRYQHKYEDSQAMLRSMLQELIGPAALLSSTGHLVAVNSDWLQLQASVGWAPGEADAGCSFLEMCQDTTAPFGDKQNDVLSGLGDVLFGNLTQYRVTYSLAGKECTMMAKPLARPAAGVLVQQRVG